MTGRKIPGPPDSGPPTLRFALDLALASTFPTAIFWSRDFRLFYNHAWAAIPADRHPWAFARPGPEVWTDIWNVVGPQMERVMAMRGGVAVVDQLLAMERDGRPQEIWWNYSFTPLRSGGSIVGVINPGKETICQASVSINSPAGDAPRSTVEPMHT
jgi:hypothetical protein